MSIAEMTQITCDCEGCNTTQIFDSRNFILDALAAGWVWRTPNGVTLNFCSGFCWAKFKGETNEK